MGEVALLQDHHSVPDVPVPEVHPHRRLCQRPATAPFDCAGPRPRPPSKRYPVSPWLVAAPVYLVYLRPQPPFNKYRIYHMKYCHR